MAVQFTRPPGEVVAMAGAFALLDTLQARDSMTDARIVLTTSGSAEEADKIALALVERRLAACVNIVPQVRSVYRWQEKVEQAGEWLLIIKTTSAAFEQVRDTIRQLHSYELPECIMLEVSEGSAPYLGWIAENTSPH